MVKAIDAREAWYMIEDLAKECERAARFIRFYADDPAELRAWALRIEQIRDTQNPGECLPARCLERAAKEARAFIGRDA